MSQDIPDPLESLLAARPVVWCDLTPDVIHPNPFQARLHFDPGQLEGLVNSIRTYGFFERLRVRPAPGQEGFYQLLYGERRLRAAKLAGLSAIPCSVGQYTDDEMVEVGLVENLEREDLSPWEEAQLFRRLLKQKGEDYTVRGLARKLGKHKNYVEERLALLRLPKDVQEVLEVQPKASLRALIEVAKLPTREAREPVVRRLREGVMSTEDVRAVVQEVLAHLRVKSVDAADVQEAVDPLVFVRQYNRLTRRMRSDLEHLEKLVEVYESAPDVRKKELLLEYIGEVAEKVQQVRRRVQ